MRFIYFLIFIAFLSVCSARTYTRGGKTTPEDEAKERDRLRERQERRERRRKFRESKPAPPPNDPNLA